MTSEINIRDFKRQKFIIFTHRFQSIDIDGARIHLIKWIENNDLIDIKGEFILNFKILNDSTNEMIVEVMIPTSKKHSSDSNIKIRREKDYKSIFTFYKGAYENLPSVYGMLHEYARKNNLDISGFPSEFYLNNPFEVDKRNLLTKIEIPVIDQVGQDIIMDKIKIKKFHYQKTANICYKGYIQEIPRVKNELIQWIDENNIDHGDFFVKFITHPDPNATNPHENIFKVGTFLNPEEKIETTSNIRIKDISPHKSLIGVYKGPYTNLHSAHRILREYAYKHNLEIVDQPIEIYLNDPLKEKPEDLKTQINMPVVHYKFNKNLKLQTPISEKSINNREYIFLRHHGPIQEVFNVRSRINTFIKKNNIYTHSPYFVRFFVHEQSLFADEMFFDVGFLTKSDDNNSVRTIEFSEHKILTNNYKGSCENLKNIYQKLVEYAEENKIKISNKYREKYYNGVKNYKDNIKTQIQIPIIKKEI